MGINPNLRAGEIADRLVIDALADQTRRKVEWISRGRRAVRRPRAADPVLPGRDHRRCPRLRRDGRPRFGITAEEGLASGQALVGTVDQICETLEQRREEWAVSYVVLGPDVFEDFAPVVARLAGT